jgi:hypothetical protein
MISGSEFEALKQDVAEIKSALLRLDKVVAALSKENNEGHEGFVRILGQVQNRFETQQAAIETLFTAVGV